MRPGRTAADVGSRHGRPTGGGAGVDLLAGRYRLGRLLGEGGVGRVHAAWDSLLHREVAVKILREEAARDPELASRFRLEARSAAGLSHRAVVKVFDAGGVEDGATPYIAMELVPGGTLKDRIRRAAAPSRLAWRSPTGVSPTGLSPAFAAAVALEVAGVLEEAHGKGIVHCDLKPENILLDAEGRAKVADFGIARAWHAGRRAPPDRATPGIFLGTAAYVSPEQALGEPAGPGSDLYSLGVVLYEMLTGRRPFEPDGPDDADPLAVAAKHIRDEPVPPRLFSPQLPEDLERIVLVLMRKDPALRHASARHLAADLGLFLGSRPPVSSPEAAASGATVAPTTPRRLRRGRPLFAALIFALLAVPAASSLFGHARMPGLEGLPDPTAWPLPDPLTQPLGRLTDYLPDGLPDGLPIVGRGVSVRRVIVPEPFASAPAPASPRSGPVPTSASPRGRSGSASPSGHTGSAEMGFSEEGAAPPAVKDDLGGPNQGFAGAGPASTEPGPLGPTGSDGSP